MDSDTFWNAIALVLVIEGLLPLFSPGGWRKGFGQLMQLRDGQLRFFGLCSILLGLFLLWLLAYSYTKRFTSLAHFWLGISLSLAPVAAWIALRGDLRWPPVLLALAVLLWVAGFDIIYACQDVDFDRRAGLRSVPERWGIRRALQVAAACHALMIVPLVMLGTVYPLGPIYFAGVAAVAVLLAYEHALVRPDDLTRVNVAFFQVNVIISLGLLTVAVVDLLV